MSPRLHLVSGFLGSGKTTAIVAAAKQHLAQGQRVGVVTNDQGRYQVDTAFVQAQDVPAVQVTEGCFCCNYADLAQVLAQLREEAQPEVIYAESVGSCADLVATVVQPLRSLRAGGIPPTSLSAYADARLLLRRLRGEPLPFSDEVLYILDQQLAESALLVANKVDLLSANDRKELASLLAQRHPDKRALLQCSLESGSVAAWVALIEAGLAPPPAEAVDVDYDRYGSGERQLAWLDLRLALRGPGEAGVALRALVAALEERLRGQQLPVGHVKLLARSEAGQAKISLTTLPEPATSPELPTFGPEIELLINARVQGQAEALRSLFHDALRQVAEEHGVRWQWLAEAAFHPIPPKARPPLSTA